MISDSMTTTRAARSMMANGHASTAALTKTTVTAAKAANFHKMNASVNMINWFLSDSRSSIAFKVALIVGAFILVGSIEAAA